jgi:hypothetical protein
MCALTTYTTNVHCRAKTVVSRESGDGRVLFHLKSSKNSADLGFCVYRRLSLQESAKEMRRKRERERRALEVLAREAHSAVHLLIELAGAITEDEPADECGSRAESLMRALKGALPYVLTSNGMCGDEQLTADKAVETQTLPGFSLEAAADGGIFLCRDR